MKEKKVSSLGTVGTILLIAGVILAIFGIGFATGDPPQNGFEKVVMYVGCGVAVLGFFLILDRNQ